MATTVPWGRLSQSPAHMSIPKGKTEIFLVRSSRDRMHAPHARPVSSPLEMIRPGMPMLTLFLDSQRDIYYVQLADPQILVPIIWRPSCTVAAARPIKTSPRSSASHRAAGSQIFTSMGRRGAACCPRHHSPGLLERLPLAPKVSRVLPLE